MWDDGTNEIQESMSDKKKSPDGLDIFYIVVLIIAGIIFYLTFQ